MALTETKTMEQVTVSANGIVGSLEVTRIFRDGVEIASSNHRMTYEPNDDLTGVDAKVVAIANTVWTSDVVSAYQAWKADITAKNSSETPQGA
jgi:hypothetical protein